MYKRESIFFLNLCLPSLDAWGLDATLCPFCSITIAIGKFGGVAATSEERTPVWWGGWPGSRLPCCFPARHQARPSLAAPASPSPPWLRWGLCSKGLGGAPPRSIWRTPAGPRAAAGSRLEQSGSWCSRPALLFQTLSCWGSLGVFCATSSHSAATVLNFIL